MNELKPCPFCGKAVTLSKSHQDCVERHCDCCNEVYFEDSGLVELSKWNTRPIEDALREEMANYKGAAKKWEYEWSLKCEEIERLNQIISSLMDKQGLENKED